MFEKTEVRRNRQRVDVSMRLSNGDAVEGEIFVAAGERVSDLFNDERAFLPVATPAGTVIVAKTQIAEVRIAEPVPEDNELDPYGTLRIEPTASDQEIRTAWMKRVKTCHPDRLAALELDPEIIQTARKVSQRINAAYDRIVRERKARSAA